PRAVQTTCPGRPEWLAPRRRQDPRRATDGGGARRSSRSPLQSRSRPENPAPMRRARSHGLRRPGSGRARAQRAGVVRLCVAPWQEEPPASLFTRLVVPLRLHELLHIVRRELRPVDGECQLVELAGEAERNLVVLVVHWRFGVGTDVEVLVPL